MAKKFSQGTFQPKNISKYVGNKSPVYRSSWEHKMFIWLDGNPSVVSWASEPVKIPYQSPINGQIKNYIPDLLIKYVDKNGKQHIELAEIKPIKETILELAKTKRDRVAYEINQSKWAQARAWCQMRGLSFRIITERDLFGVK